MTTAEHGQPCSRRCGYVSHGADLIDHETREHVTCTECGRSPLTDWDSVTHELDCPRLAAAGGGRGAVMTAPEAECEAETRLHPFEDGSEAFLVCDLALTRHAGLCHHDPVIGIWWAGCDLPEHAHALEGTRP